MRKLHQSWIKKASEMKTSGSAKSFYTGKGGGAKKQFGKTGNESVKVGGAINPKDAVRNSPVNTYGGPISQGYGSAGSAKSLYNGKGGNSKKSYAGSDMNTKAYKEEYGVLQKKGRTNRRREEMSRRSAFNKLPENYEEIAGTTTGNRFYKQNSKKRKQVVRGKPTQNVSPKTLKEQQAAQAEMKAKGGAAPTFNVSGNQGLDKLRYMESRGAKPNEQMRRNALSGDMRRNFAEQGGMSRVGVSALRGAAVGGVAGGTVESMQGGDFWDGAKSGAFYGATGMAGVRATRQAVGAQSYIGKNGIMGTMKMNKENYGVGVKDLLLNQQNVGRAQDVINSTRKK